MIRVMIADDHTIFRAGLARILDEDPEVTVVAEAADGQELLTKIGQADCDVILLDISMPGESGVELLKRIKRIKPDQYVLMLSMYSEEQYALRVLRAGASGYLTKESTPDKVLSAIRKVAAGRRYVSPNLGEELALRLDKAFKTPRHEMLSDRENQIMIMIASGKTLQEIAKDLSLSIKTISTYKARLLDKMNMKTEAELANYANRHNLI